MLVDHNDVLDLFQVPFMRSWLEARRQFSVSAWFKRAAGTSGRVGIVNNGNWSLCEIDGDGSFLIDMDDDDVIGGLAIKDESLQETSGYTVDNSSWHNAILVYNGQALELFVDGVQTSYIPKSGLIDQPNNPMFIGLSGCADNAGYFDGLIDDVRVYATPLTERQVLALATGRGEGTGSGSLTGGGNKNGQGSENGGGSGNAGGVGNGGGAGNVGGNGQGSLTGSGNKHGSGEGQGMGMDCDGLALHFPFNTNLKDVSCNMAGWHKVGLGNIAIVEDMERGKVARFDGQTALEVPFMRRWLQARREFSVSAWFKQAAGTSGRVGIVNNGNWSLCEYDGDGSFLIELDDEDVIGGLAVQGESLEVTSGYPVTNATWHNAILVYNGQLLELYIDGLQTANITLPGLIDQPNNSMFIGLTGCADNAGYFEGLIDDLGGNAIRARQRHQPPVSSASIDPRQLPPCAHVDADVNEITIRTRMQNQSMSASDGQAGNTTPASDEPSGGRASVRVSGVSQW
ncbi:hypothetical protein LSAT2_016587 [Lamellibrachia satsuma]|nr:hypothetical protein LSAT2_016587 [Lamellibrachia satsuma]